MKPDELKEHIKKIKGLDRFPIKDHGHLRDMLGGKETKFKFKEKDVTAEDVLRIFPANYFPIESEEDMTKKAAKLLEIGRYGFQPATGKRPDVGGPPALTRELQEDKKENDSDGHAKDTKK